ncbi:MAG: hypothetical protein A2731_00380 [Candidatus Buchananbacteria bacterium RIFCSPHIGHO2_01_FULL_39_8]|uniref:Uncharacterized protein n=1 Tax=Candidatus Buchananbacteria bacterium RIFCSPHIGHO2_01_FULL_39_8 TaxID=1797533 RepID=A0A1G1Y099_9BACT|nr:MAG: hypothetical protein A2731_00380 [Candidatus Buchananbacteria bacterium RIFCSPHIGHO2_01_FULL_39_8]
MINSIVKELSSLTFFGAKGGIRTHDLLIIPILYQIRDLGKIEDPDYLIFFKNTMSGQVSCSTLSELPSLKFGKITKKLTLVLDQLVCLFILFFFYIEQNLNQLV